MVSLMRSSVTRTRECSAVPLLQPTMLAVLAFFLFLLHLKKCMTELFGFHIVWNNIALFPVK